MKVKTSDKLTVNQILSDFEKRDINNLNSKIANLVKIFPKSNIMDIPRYVL